MGDSDVVGPPITDAEGVGRGFDPLLLLPLSLAWYFLVSDMTFFEAGRSLAAPPVVGVPVPWLVSGLSGCRVVALLMGDVAFVGGARGSGVGWRTWSSVCDVVSWWCSKHYGV